MSEKNECGTCGFLWLSDGTLDTQCPVCETESLRAANRRLLKMRQEYIKAFGEPMRDGEDVGSFARRVIDTLKAERDALAAQLGQPPIYGDLRDACGVLATEYRREQAAHAVTTAERDAQGLFLKNAKRAQVELETAIQNDAPHGFPFEGVFVDKDDRPHLGYRRPDSKEVASPFHLVNLPGADPELGELVYFYKNDDEGPDESGDECHVGLVMYEGDYIALKEQRILPKYRPFTASDRVALRAAYDAFVLNTETASDESSLGRQRTLLADLLRGWGVEVPK